MVEEGKQRFPAEEAVETIWRKLRGKKKQCDAALMKHIVGEVIEVEPDFQKVRYEA